VKTNYGNMTTKKKKKEKEKPKKKRGPRGKK
jgi:hypothetical protein